MLRLQRDKSQDTNAPAARKAMRRGLNRMELGIVLVILAVLVALLLPAVQKVREAAARTSCQNNLKSHGFAIHNYHDQHNHFPPGTMPNAALPPEERLSFHVALVPYIEASPLYKLIAKAEPWDSPANVAAVADYTAWLYRCPSWTSGPKDAPLHLAGHLAFTNYVGVAGVGADAATRPVGAPGVGMFGYDRTLKKDDAKDGLENTLLVVETGRNVGPWIRGGPSTARAVEVADAPLAGIDRAFGGTHLRRTWTFQIRADGFNVLLADSAVRFTKPDIAPEVLAALATVAGGEEIPANW
jgi:Tfp pilus assembly protein PilE